MKIGVCAGISSIEKVAAYGADYIELDFSALARAEEDVLPQYTALSGDIRCEAMNLLFPGGEIPLVGPEADMGKIDAYLDKGFARAGLVHPEYVVFGSGRARTAPEGYPEKDAFEQLCAVAFRIAEYAKREGITAVIEPLNRQETNCINTLLEGKQLVEAVGHSNFRLLADYYHIQVEKEPLEHIAECKDFLVHAHIAVGAARACPNKETELKCVPFFQALEAAGYTGRISIEANLLSADRELPEGIAVLKGIL